MNLAITRPKLVSEHLQKNSVLSIWIIAGCCRSTPLHIHSQKGHRTAFSSCTFVWVKLYNPPFDKGSFDHSLLCPRMPVQQPICSRVVPKNTLVLFQFILSIYNERSLVFYQLIKHRTAASSCTSGGHGCFYSPIMETLVLSVSCSNPGGLIMMPLNYDSPWPENRLESSLYAPEVGTYGPGFCIMSNPSVTELCLLNCVNCSN